MKSSAKVFGGMLQRWTHASAVCNCEMTFSIYLPQKALEGAKVPALYWLSGLTCTDENFSGKSGFARAASAHGLAVVIPDTSPRGVTIEGADDSWDFGSGAGFYVDATAEPWATATASPAPSPSRSPATLSLTPTRRWPAAATPEAARARAPRALLQSGATTAATILAPAARVGRCQCRPG